MSHHPRRLSHAFEYTRSDTRQHCGAARGAFELEGPLDA
jgi:hypothetical protein